MVKVSCGTCAHWTHRTDDDEGWGVCKMGRSEDGKPETETTLAYASDSDCYAANLLTDQLFLCMQHQEKS